MIPTHNLLINREGSEPLLSRPKSSDEVIRRSHPTKSSDEVIRRSPCPGFATAVP